MTEKKKAKRTTKKGAKSKRAVKKKSAKNAAPVTPETESPVTSEATSTEVVNENTQEAQEQNSEGVLNFDIGIITEIAVREIGDVEGVAELSGTWRTRGVEVTEPTSMTDGYVLNIRIAVEYGVNCVALAETIRSRIGGAIFQMTGRPTDAINIHLTGIKEKDSRTVTHDDDVHLGEEHGIDF